MQTFTDTVRKESFERKKIAGWYDWAKMEMQYPADWEEITYLKLDSTFYLWGDTPSHQKQKNEKESQHK